jgi:hypothetical protein
VCPSWVGDDAGERDGPRAHRVGDPACRQIRGEAGGGGGRAASQDVFPQRLVEAGGALACQAAEVSVLGLLDGEGDGGQDVRDQVDREELSRGQRRGQPGHARADNQPELAEVAAQQ